MHSGIGHELGIFDDNAFHFCTISKQSGKEDAKQAGSSDDDKPPN
jgi:hypothetical protein